MTKDEMKNRISMTLKDPILQQGFEIICKNLSDLEKENAELKKEVEKHKWNDIFLEDCTDYDKKIAEEYTTLQERIAELEKENAKLKEQLEIEQNARGDWFGKAVTKDSRLNEAKEIIRMVIDSYKHKERFSFEKDLKKAEQFLKEVS